MRHYAFLAGVVLAVAAAPSAQAYTHTDWQTGTSNWSISGNWTNGVPDGSHDAWVNNSGTAQITSGYNYVQDLFLGRSSGESGTVALSGGNLYAGHNQYVGYDGTGTVTQTTGDSYCSYGYSDYDLYLGYSNTGTGIYTMSGGNFYAGDEWIGRYGTGTFTQSAGTNYVSASGSSTTDHMYIGYASSNYSGNGSYRLSGTGQLVFDMPNSKLYVGCTVGGNNGTGRFEWFRSGGITMGGGANGRMELGTSGTLAMGYDFNADSLMNGTLIPISGLNNATLEITNGAKVTKNVSGTTCGVVYLRIGSATGAGSADLSNGTVQVGQTEYLGDGGDGTVVQTGGTHNITVHLYMGLNGAQGTYRLKGGSLNVSSNIFGGSGTGTMVLDGGTLNLSGTIFNVTNLVLGDEQAGSWTLGSGKTLTVSNHIVGKNTTGTFTQSGGANNATALIFGQNAGGVGTYNLNGGSLNVGSVTTPAGTGTLVLNGGTFSPTGSVGLTDLTVGQSTTVDYTQAAQTFTVGDALAIGYGSYKVPTGASLSVGSVANGTGSGTLILDGGSFSTSGPVSADALTVGQSTTVNYTQATHTFTVGGALTLGYGSYKVPTGASLSVGSVANGTGTGTFILDGGSFTTGGSVSADNLTVGETTTVDYVQPSQTFTVGNALTIGYGSYKVPVGASLSVGQVANGSGTGTLSLAGGSFTCGGNLGVDYLRVGDGATASYTQTANSYAVGADLVIGAGGAGTWTAQGGSLTTTNLTLGQGSSGTLNIGNAAATITVTSALVFGDQARLSAVSGSRIMLTGSNVYNSSTTPTNLADMTNLTLSFLPRGMVQPNDTMEVACEDRGVSMSGFDDNFALGTLILGVAPLGGDDLGGSQDASTLTLKLVDLVDNVPGSGTEALYLHNLYVHANTTLDMTGINVYYDGLFEKDGKIVGGTPLYVPEPATLLLLGLGLGGLLLRRKRP